MDPKPCSSSSVSLPVPFSVVRSSWQQRGVKGKCDSVVQAMFYRELGLPHFSRSGDCMSNGACEKVIGRHLLKRRAAEAGSWPASNPTTVELKGVKDRNEHTTLKPREGRTVWFTINLDKSSSQIYYMSGMFWKVSQSRCVDPFVGARYYSTKKEYNFTFFKPYPGRHIAFREFPSIDVDDKVVGFEVISCRQDKSCKVQMPTYLLTLTKKGLLSAINVGSVERVKKAELSRLPSNYFPPLINRFTDLSINNESGQIYALSALGGKAQSLYIISYPPFHVDRIISLEVPLKIQLCGASIVILERNHVELTSIDTLIKLTENNICRIKPDSFNVVEDGTLHRTLTTRPEPIYAIETLHGYFGALESTWPPLCFSKSKTGLRIGRFDREEPIWTCDLGPYMQFLFQPMPDGSNCTFVSRNGDQFVLTWKQETDDPNSYSTTNSLPFIIDFKAGTKNDAPVRKTQRPRLCKSRVNYAQAASNRVLGISYCDELDLLLVCTDEKECLLVTMYEPRTYKIFKRLPPVIAFETKMQRRRVSSSSSDDDDQNIAIVDEIKTFNIEIDYEMIFIEIHFKNDSKIFCMRFLDENASVNSDSVEEVA